MERYDARKETFEEIEIFDTLALFSSGRIQRESVPKGFYCYEVRHDDECMGIPCELSFHVLVNFWGSNKKNLQTQWTSTHYNAWASSYVCYDTDRAGCFIGKDIKINGT